MSPLQRTSLGIAGLIVVAGLAGLGAGWLGDSHGLPDALERDRAGDGLAPRSEAPVDEQSPAGLREAPTRHVVAPTEPTSWDVRVIDPKGALQPGASIRATAPDGETRLEAAGPRVLWGDIEPGEWRLVVEHSDYPTYDAVVALEAGARNRRIVRLDTKLRLTGRVIDRFGEPRGGERLWFLRPGERHPGPGGITDESGPIAVVSDRAGQFRVDLPAFGEWRVSVGPIGSVLAAVDQPRELHPGGPDALEIVLGETTHLALVCSEPPSTRSPATAMIMMRYEDGARGRDAAVVLDTVDPPRTREDPARGSDPRREERARREELRTRLQDREKGLAPPPGLPDMAEVPEWIARSSARFDASGRITFQNLPAHQDLRLAISRSGERHESVRTFALRPDQRATIELTLPEPSEPKESTESDVAVPPAPLAIRFRTEPLPTAERPPGFRWHTSR